MPPKKKGVGKKKDYWRGKGGGGGQTFALSKRLPVYTHNPNIGSICFLASKLFLSILQWARITTESWVLPRVQVMMKSKNPTEN